MKYERRLGEMNKWRDHDLENGSGGNDFGKALIVLLDQANQVDVHMPKGLVSFRKKRLFS
jgi:hypothetical protein